MSDFDVKVIAESLGKTLKGIEPLVQKQLNQAVADVAHVTHASIISQMQSRSANPKNRQDYLRGLQLNQIGKASWLISLDGEWANKLENGFASYSIKDVLLASKKTVQVGSRAGQPWVRTAKDGHKWAIVPFEHHPSSGEKTHGSGDLAKDLKKLFAVNKASGRKQSFSSTFFDPNTGQPLQGKVASVSVPNQPNLANITKYQHTYAKATSSVYMTFRAVSEKSTGFIHPGFKGYKLFAEAEKQVEQQLKDIVNILL